MAKASFDYNQKSVELEEILCKLQDSSVDIGEATKLHARGVTLADEIEAYLKKAKNEVQTHDSEK